MNLYIYTRAVNWQLQLVGQYEKNGLQNDTKDQKVIQIDALRTRTQLFDDELRKCLIDVLNIYQSNKHHSYKQGLNELAAPFVYLNKASLDSDKIYDLLNTFIETYMTNFFDNDFASLQNLFLLLDFLIQYHDKEIHNYFQRKMVSSQLFACPWMVTMFVSKSTFPASLLIIEHQLLSRNKYFILFFCTAVIIQQREKILKSGQYPPMILTKIEVDIDDFYSYLKLAIQLQQSTPANYFEYVDNTHVFGPNNSVFQNKIEILKVSAQEIIQHVKNIKKNQFQLANFKQENEQLKKLKEIYRTTLGLNFLPVLVFPYIKTDIHCNAHFVSLNTIPRATIKAQLINLSLTNKLWICIFDSYENALKLSHSELFNEFSYFNYFDELHLSQSQDQNIQILEYIIYQFKKQHNTDKVQIISDDDNLVSPQQLFGLPHVYLTTPGINLNKDPTFVRDIKYIYKPSEDSCLIEKFKGKRKIEQTTITYGSIKAMLSQHNENTQQYQAKAPVIGQSFMQTKFEAPLLSNEEVAQRIKVNVKGGQIQFSQLPRTQRVPRAITQKEVMEHDKPNDCWTVYNGKVYDITRYQDFHPGGRDKLFLGAGKDCTRLFNQFHPWVNGHAFLEKDYLGPLKG